MPDVGGDVGEVTRSGGEGEGVWQMCIRHDRIYNFALLYVHFIFHQPTLNSTTTQNHPHQPQHYTALTREGLARPPAVLPRNVEVVDIYLIIRDPERFKKIAARGEWKGRAKRAWEELLVMLVFDLLLSLSTALTPAFLRSSPPLT